MSVQNLSRSTLPSTATEATFDAYLEGQLEDPAFRAAFEDARRRQGVIDTLVNLRKLARVTQRRLAERMGVGQSTVSGFETEGADPRLSTLQRYARAAGGEVRVVVSVPTVCDWVESSSSVYSAQEAGVRGGTVCRLDTAQRWSRPPEWKSA